MAKANHALSNSAQVYKDATEGDFFVLNYDAEEETSLKMCMYVQWSDYQNSKSPVFSLNTLFLHAN